MVEFEASRRAGPPRRYRSSHRK